MDRYAAFLRGINLGKNRRVKGEELCAALEGIGLAEVAAFRASGNLVFTTPEKGEKEAALRKRVEAGLAEALGIEVVAFLRTARQVKAVAAHEPFEARAASPAGKLQVAFLQRPPGAAARRRALAMGSAEDPIAIRGRELYWWPRGRMVESDLDLKALEAAVGEWTMRTMGTVEQLAARFLGN